MEPTEFEKWCAGEMGCIPKYIMAQRRTNSLGEDVYILNEIGTRCRAWMAGVTSMLPYQTLAKGATNEG